VWGNTYTNLHVTFSSTLCDEGGHFLTQRPTRQRLEPLPS
jgi:hypothetical protein